MRKKREPGKLLFSKQLIMTSLTMALALFSPNTSATLTTRVEGMTSLINTEITEIKMEGDKRLPNNRYENLLKKRDDSKTGTLDSRVLLLESEMKILKTKNINQNEELKIVKKKLSSMNETVFKLKSDHVIKEDGSSKNSPPRTLLKSTIIKPKNCEDLELMGHKLNGFYLVQEKHKNAPLGGKFKTVYCDFSSSTKPQFANKNTAVPITETIGYIDTKSLTRGVQFYVQRNISLSSSGKEKTMNFQIERLNIGGGMNLKTGIFTSPVTGIYYFAFSANKGRSEGFGAEVMLYLNGKSVAKSYATAIPWATLSLFSTLELKSGDKVYLRKGVGDEIYSRPDSLTTHFCGWLIEEGLN